MKDSAKATKTINLSIQSVLIKYNALLILLALIIISSCISPYFLTAQNIFNVLRQQVTYILIALGVMLTLMTAGIDLSVSAVAGCANVIVAICIQAWGKTNSSALFLAIIVTILLGCALGAINGLLIGKLRMAAFIITLAMMTAGQGFAYLMTNGAQIPLLTDNAAANALIWFGVAKDPVIGMPLLVYLAIIVVLILYFVMKYTPFGRLVLAVGSNEAAVRLAGINVTKYKMIVYIISGALASMAGIVVSARTALGAPVTSTSDFALTTVAACVIGGVALEGGKGTVLFTIVGVFILALITNIMNLLGVTSYPQSIIKGFIIVLAIFLRQLGEKK